VDVVAAVGADAESAAVLQPGEGAFDDPAVSAEAGAVFDLAASDDRLDSAFPDEPAVLVVVVAAVGDQRPRPAARPADAAADIWYAVCTTYCPSFPEAPTMQILMVRVPGSRRSVSRRTPARRRS
jgi:hypothetical protein